MCSGFWSLCSVVDPDPNSNADSDSYTNAEADSNTDADANTDADPDSFNNCSDKSDRSIIYG